MPFPFPTRTLSSTLADHLEDHNTIATILDQSAFTLSSTRDEHLAHHNLLHPDFGLPTRSIGDSATNHLNDHGTLHANLIQTYAGIRGFAGQRNPSLIPDFPTTFTSSHSTFASLLAAVNSAGTGRRFRITSSITADQPLVPHSSDEFWGDDGVIIFRNVPAAPASAFSGDTSGADDVRIMNLTIKAFVNRAVSAGTLAGSTNWEVGYCTIDGENTMPVGLSAHWRHHCIIKNIAGEGAISAFRAHDDILEDCEIGPSSGAPAGNKFTGSRRIIARHNWIHHQGLPGTQSLQGSGIWLDYGNQDALLEWNLIENCSGAGVFFEANNWDDDTGAPMTGFCTTRHNLIRNNNGPAVALAQSSHNEIYENKIENNVAVSGEAEFNLGLSETGQNGDLIENHIYRNHVTCGAHRGGFLNIDPAYPNAAAYIANTKDNTWDFNTYDFTTPGGANLFRKQSTNMSFAQWQAGNIPATAGPQDVNGSAI